MFCSPPRDGDVGVKQKTLLWPATGWGGGWPYTSWASSRPFRTPYAPLTHTHSSHPFCPLERSLSKATLHAQWRIFRLQDNPSTLLIYYYSIKSFFFSHFQTQWTTRESEIRLYWHALPFSIIYLYRAHVSSSSSSGTERGPNYKPVTFFRHFFDLIIIIIISWNEITRMPVGNLRFEAGRVNKSKQSAQQKSFCWTWKILAESKYVYLFDAKSFCVNLRWMNN